MSKLAFLFLVAWSAAAPAVAQDAADERGADEVAQVLLDARRTDAKREDLAARLANPGSHALPALFATLEAGSFAVHIGERGNSRRRLTAAERNTLIAALGLLPWPDVSLFLDALRAETPAEARRLAALELLGAHGTLRDLPAFVSWSEPEERSARIPRARREAFGAALGALLDRRPEDLNGLWSVYGSAHPSLLPAILSALGTHPSAACLEVLCEFLGVVAAADVLVLMEISQVAKSVPKPIGLRARERVRPYLDDARQDLLVEGILATRRLEDSEAVPRLIELLAHADEVVRERSHEALVEITGERLGKDPEVWQEWYVKAQAWWQNTAPGLLEAVRFEMPDLASRAVLQLSKQRFFRHELAVPLAHGLERPDPQVVIVTCAALGHLGSPLAEGPLTLLLEDESSDVQRAALLALRRIQGIDPRGEQYGGTGTATRAR